MKRFALAWMDLLVTVLAGEKAFAVVRRVAGILPLTLGRPDLATIAAR